MKIFQFRRLKIGDTVTLSERRLVYGHFPEGWDGRAYIPAGTQGVIGATNVPTVTGKERVFVCVDFPPDTPLIGSNGRTLEIENPHGNKRRTSAYAHELK